MRRSTSAGHSRLGASVEIPCACSAGPSHISILVLVSIEGLAVSIVRLQRRAELREEAVGGSARGIGHRRWARSAAGRRGGALRLERVGFARALFRGRTEE